MAPEATAADGVKRVGAIRFDAAALATPSLKADALPRRRARAVPIAAGSALRLGAVVTAPAIIACALTWTVARAVARAAAGTLRLAAGGAAPACEAFALARG